LVSSGGGADDYQKAARNVVAAYLNAKWGMPFPYTPEGVAQLWAAAVDENDPMTFIEVHNMLSAANSPQDGFCPVGK
jgi:pyruvate/2-oxoglutarate/acetoin dehydrogenase E1 component